MTHEHQAPSEVVESIERLRVLNNVLNTLPENQKVAFSLSKYDEMSLEEIAEILNTSVSNVESLINRAKKNLKKKLFSYYKKQIG